MVLMDPEVLLRTPTPQMLPAPSADELMVLAAAAASGRGQPVALSSFEGSAFSLPAMLEAAAEATAAAAAAGAAAAAYARAPPLTAITSFAKATSFTVAETLALCRADESIVRCVVHVPTSCLGMAPRLVSVNLFLYVDI